jgi:hypothetical protein
MCRGAALFAQAKQARQNNISLPSSFTFWGIAVGVPQLKHLVVSLMVYSLNGFFRFFVTVRQILSELKNICDVSMA